MHLVTWVLLIQVISISIDPMDPVSDKLGRLFCHEDLSVSEQFLGVDVPEHDQDDERGKIMDFYFTDTFVKIKTKNQELQISFFAREKNFNSVVLDHTSPPPKVV